MKAFRIIVFGEVQGVSFRRAVQREARKLQIVGTVKNNRDGSVEIIAQSGYEKIELLTNSIRALGSPISVDSLEMKPVAVSKSRKYFEIVHGKIEEELDEGLGAGEAQLSSMRKEMTEGFGGMKEEMKAGFDSVAKGVGRLQSDVSTKFDYLATRYDVISETLAKVVEESTQSREDFREAIDALTAQTRDFKEALVSLTGLAREYFDERRKDQAGTRFPDDHFPSSSYFALSIFSI